jgi:hypothetical protein
MRAVIKHLIKSYYAIDDELIVVKKGVVSVISFNRNLATDVANWLVRHLADRGFELITVERFMDYEVRLVPKRRNN